MRTLSTAHHIAKQMDIKEMVVVPGLCACATAIVEQGIILTGTLLFHSSASCYSDGTLSESDCGTKEELNCGICWVALELEATEFTFTYSDAYNVPSI
jgi:hypothetical protein